MQVPRKSDQKCRLYSVNKKKTNGWTDEQRKLRHDISSAGFQPVELITSNDLVEGLQKYLSHSVYCLQILSIRGYPNFCHLVMTLKLKHYKYQSLD